MRVLVTLILVALAGVTLAHLYRDYWRHPWTRDGHVRAQVVTIAPRLGGPIIELPITDNQVVKRGDLLFRIDPRTFKAQLDQATAAVKTAQAHAAEAKWEAEREHQIYDQDKGAISELTVTQRDNARDAAYAAVTQAEANWEMSEFNPVRTSMALSGNRRRNPSCTACACLPASDRSSQVVKATSPCVCCPPDPCW